MKDRDILEAIEMAKVLAARYAAVTHAMPLTLLIVGGLLLAIQITHGAATNDVSNNTKQLEVTSAIGTNYLREVGLNTTNVPTVKTNGMAVAVGASALNWAWSLGDILALPADKISTNRLLDFPAWDNISNSIPTDAKTSKGNHRMRSR